MHPENPKLSKLQRGADCILIQAIEAGNADANLEFIARALNITDWHGKEDGADARSAATITQRVRRTKTSPMPREVAEYERRIAELKAELESTKSKLRSALVFVNRYALLVQRARERKAQRQIEASISA